MDNHKKFKKTKNQNIPNKWSLLSYTNTQRVPDAEEPNSSSWNMYYFKKDVEGNYIDSKGSVVALKIRRPDSSIDFQGEQLEIVEDTLQNLTRHQKKVAEYWGTGPATKQWTPIIDSLIDTYKITAPRAGRILAAIQSAINDAFIIAWDYKFKWDVPRPNQLNQKLESFLEMPLHPTYPSGHATIAGVSEVVLGYFFKPEKNKLKNLAEECAMSRLYAGVHFPIDNSEGLRLGRHIGKIIVRKLKKQYDEDGIMIDLDIEEFKDANLRPPPYTQALPSV